jgi:hypothetical protein
MGKIAAWFNSLLREPTPVAASLGVGPAKIKGVAQHGTVADRLDWLCNKHKAVYNIRRPIGGVVVVLDLPGEDVVSSGIQSSTAAAVQVLYDKLEGK